jgi:hypothetical protein
MIELSLQEEGYSNYTGMGDNVVQLRCQETKQVVCVVGDVQGEEKIYFPTPVSKELLQAVAALLDKKKLRKAIEKHDYIKAQKFADKKFEC